VEATSKAPTLRRPSMPEVVKSAVRALEILELFDRFQRPVSVGEVIADLGYPQSSTSALLRSMVKVGYLTYDVRNRTFVPTSRVALLGGCFGDPFLQEGPVLSAARRLMERTNLSVGVGRRNGGMVQWLHAVVCGELKPGDVYGAPASLMRSGVGLSLLASMDVNLAKGLIHRLNSEAESIDEIVPPADLMTRIAQIRRDGYALAQEGGITMMGAVAPVAITDEPVALALIDPAGQLADCAEEMFAIMEEELAALEPNPPSQTVAFRRPASVSTVPCVQPDRIAAHG